MYQHVPSKRDPAGAPARHHGACSKSWSLPAFLNQIISDVPPSPGQRFRGANLTSSTVCSLANYQPAAAFSAGAPGGMKRCHPQLLPTHTSHIPAGWRRFQKQARWAGAAQIVLRLIPHKDIINKGKACDRCSLQRMSPSPGMAPSPGTAPSLETRVAAQNQRILLNSTNYKQSSEPHGVMLCHTQGQQLVLPVQTPLTAALRTLR